MGRARTGVLLALLLTGCAIETRDLEAFRATARGPEKLYALLADASRPSTLRAEAALQLLDLERRDVDGRTLLFQALSQLDAPSRRAILPSFERGLFARMETPVGHAPTPAAVRAKDVGVELMALLDASGRERLGHALLAWMGRDLSMRADVGSQRYEAIAASVGSVAARTSSESLTPKLSAKELTRLVSDIDKHADEALRAQAAAKIVAIEQAYRAQPNREHDLVGHALPALARFLDTEPAHARLLAIAADPSVSVGQREQALRMLEARVQREDVAALSTIALDGGATLAVRELALTRIGETRAKEALPTLLALAGERYARSLRQPAVELAIELGGERTLSALFRALPNHWNASYAKSELDAYAAHVERLPPTGYLVALLNNRLSSAFFWVRVIAIRYLVAKGNPPEVAGRLRALVDDPQEVVGEGWPARWTIGREAMLGLRALGVR